MRFILGASQWPWRQCRRATSSIIRHSSTNNHSNTSTAASAIEAKRREARLGGGRARIDAQHSKVAKNISMIPLKRVFLTILVGKINCPRATESFAWQGLVPWIRRVCRASMRGLWNAGQSVCRRRRGYRSRDHPWQDRFRVQPGFHGVWRKFVANERAENS